MIVHWKKRVKPVERIESWWEPLEPFAVCVVMYIAIYIAGKAVQFIAE